MRRIEFTASPGTRLEIQEVDKDKNVLICPAQRLDKHPYLGGRAVKQYKIKIEYEAIPIMEGVI